MYSLHRDAVIEAKASVVSEYTAEYVQQLEKSLQASKELFEGAIQEKAKLENEIKVTTARHLVLIDSLRNRPSRNDSKSNEANITASCPPPSVTGSSLFREDGEFLAGEAASATAITKERDFYYEQYEDARKKLEALNGKD